MKDLKRKAKATRSHCCFVLCAMHTTHCIVYFDVRCYEWNTWENENAVIFSHWIFFWFRSIVKLILFIKFVGKEYQNSMRSKIVMQTRRSVLIADSEGNITKYEPVTNPTTPKRKLTPRTPVPRTPVPRKPMSRKPTSRKPTLIRPKMSKAEEAAKKLKPCKVNVEVLTKNRIENIQRWVKRQHQMQAIDDKMKRLTCKNLLIISINLCYLRE